MSGSPIVDLDALSTEQRIKLLEDVWEHLSQNENDVAVTGAQRQELDRRLDELEREPEGGIPWDQVLQRIRTRD